MIDTCKQCEKEFPRQGMTWEPRCPACASTCVVCTAPHGRCGSNNLRCAICDGVAYDATRLRDADGAKRALAHATFDVNGRQVGTGMTRAELAIIAAQDYPARTRAEIQAKIDAQKAAMDAAKVCPQCGGETNMSWGITTCPCGYAQAVAS